jgi:hypothetical protein
MDIETSILTINKGWSLIGNLRVGDIVYNSSSSQSVITRVSRNFIPPAAYKVKLNTNETFTCLSSQCWKTLTSKQVTENLQRNPEWREKRKRKRPSRALENPKRPAQSIAVKLNNSLRVFNYLEKNTPSFKPTDEILSTLYVRKSRKNHIMEVCASLETPDFKIPIDAYTFGAFLGDGAAVSTKIIMEIRDWKKIEHLIPYKVAHEKIEGKTDNLYNRRYDGLRQDLQKVLPEYYKQSPGGKKYKVFKKIIPNCIFTTSKKIRLEFLKGLMDTDGTVDKNRGRCEIGFSNYELALGTLRLLASLGIKSTLRGKKVKKGEKHYRMQFNSYESVFNLERKKQLQDLHPKKEYVCRRYVDEILITEPIKMKLIEVDNGDADILVGDTLIATKCIF